MTFALALCMSLAVLYIQRQTHTTEAFSFFADRVRACGEHRRSLCAPGCARSDVYTFPPFIFSTLLYPKSQALGILKKRESCEKRRFSGFCLACSHSGCYNGAINRTEQSMEVKYIVHRQPRDKRQYIPITILIMSLSIISAGQASPIIIPKTPRIILPDSPIFPLS